jgi:hypothetical protein
VTRGLFKTNPVSSTLITYQSALLKINTGFMKTNKVYNKESNDVLLNTNLLQEKTWLVPFSKVRQYYPPLLYIKALFSNTKHWFHKA